MSGRVTADRTRECGAGARVRIGFQSPSEPTCSHQKAALLLPTPTPRPGSAHERPLPHPAPPSPGPAPQVCCSCSPYLAGDLTQVRVCCQAREGENTGGVLFTPRAHSPARGWHRKEMPQMQVDKCPGRAPSLRTRQPPPGLSTPHYHNSPCHSPAGCAQLICAGPYNCPVLQVRKLTRPPCPPPRVWDKSRTGRAQCPWDSPPTPA